MPTRCQFLGQHYAHIQALAVNQRIVIQMHMAVLLNTWLCFHMELKLWHSTLFKWWKKYPSPYFCKISAMSKVEQESSLLS